MRTITLTIGVAAVAIAFPGVNAAEPPDASSRGPAYEQTQVDRSLPTTSEKGVAAKREYGSPYEEFELGRALPQFPERMTPTPPSGIPAVEGEASAGASMPAGAAWDKDHNFVAPAP